LNFNEIIKNWMMMQRSSKGELSFQIRFIWRRIFFSGDNQFWGRGVREREKKNGSNVCRDKKKLLIKQCIKDSNCSHIHTNSHAVECQWHLRSLLMERQMRCDKNFIENYAFTSLWALRKFIAFSLAISRVLLPIPGLHRERRKVSVQ
jgi:hypothetical protein